MAYVIGYLVIVGLMGFICAFAGDSDKEPFSDEEARQRRWEM